jgi:hypothetical protein
VNCPKGKQRWHPAMPDFYKFPMTIANQFIDEMKSNNTKKKTKTDLKILLEWLQGGNELMVVEDIPTAELNQYIASIFLSDRSQNNEE